MKKLLVFLSIIVMIFGALSIAEATVIDNLPRTGYMGGFGDSWATYWGQSFIAEPGLAQSLTFELRYGLGDGDLNFRVLLTTVDGQWNGVDYSDVNPGIVLFESETLTLPHMPHNSEWMSFSVELGGIDLEDGETYAFVLDAFEDGDGIQSKALVGMRDGYQDGHTFWLAYSKTYLEDSFPNSDRDDYFNNLYWGNNVDRAMAFSLTFTPVPEPVDIDIKPGSFPNCINNNGHGVIPVAILGSPDFDCTTKVDPETISLEGLSIKMVGKSNKYLAHYEDVNHDGYDDLVLQIEDSDAVFQEGQTTATLTGNLYEEYGGTEIEGTDTICIVP